MSLSNTLLFAPLITNIYFKDKNPGEFFRLVAGGQSCRDVVACAENGLQAIR